MKSNLSLNQCVNKYYDIIVMGDLNINISDKRKDKNNFLSDLYGNFSLQNIITGKTCRKSNIGTPIEIMLTNRPGSFHKTSIFETGMSDHHKFILSRKKLIPPKIIEYGKYKTLDKSKFLHDLYQELLKGAIYLNNEEK